MKKISCVVLCLAMLAEMLCFSVYADESGSDQNSNLTKAIRVLDRIGIIEIPSNGNLSTQEKVTRAEFAEYAAKIIKATPIAKRIYFFDVDENNWAFESICALVERGYVNGFGNKVFYPEQYITLDEACKILLDAAGYGEYANSKGGYPYGYAGVVASSGLAPKIEDRDALNLGEVAQLIYNIATIGIYKVSSVYGGVSGEVGHVYNTDSEETLLSAFHDIYIRRGQVTSIHGASMPDRGVSKINEMYLDDNIFYTDDELVLDDYFTNYAEIIFEMKEKEGIGNVFHIESIKRNSNEIKIHSNNFVSFDRENYEITYYRDENSVYKITNKIYKGADVIYNGSPYKDSLSEALNEFYGGRKKGYIRIKDTDNDGRYDLVIIKSYRSYLVSYINSEKTLMYNMFDNEDVIKISNYQEAIIRNRSLNYVDITDRTPFVISAAESKDGRNIEIITNNEIISGVLTAIHETEKALQIDDNYFNVNEQFWNIRDHILDEYGEIRLITGDGYKIYMDYFGDVCYVEPSVGIETDLLIGYLTKGSINKNSSFDMRCYLELYTEKGELEIFPLAKKVTIDKEVYRSDSQLTAILDAFPGTESSETNPRFKRQIIRYKLNDENEITVIDTYNLGKNEDERNSLTVKHDGSGRLIYGNNTRRFGVDVLYSASQTKIFLVPQTEADGSIYLNGVEIEDTIDLYSRTATFTHDTMYYLETYNYDYNNPFENIIVVRQQNSVVSTTLVMVDRLGKALDSNKQAVNKLFGRARGDEVSYLVDETISDSALNELSQGDIIRVYLDPSRTKITEFVKQFDAEHMDFVKSATSENPHWFSGVYSRYEDYYRVGRYQLSKGYAYDIRNNVLRWKYDIGKDDDYIQGHNYNYDLGRDDYESINVSALSVTIFDPMVENKNRRLYRGTLDDVECYLSVGEKCDIILFNASYNNAVQLFVYKNYRK